MAEHLPGWMMQRLNAEELLRLHGAGLDLDAMKLVAYGEPLTCIECASKGEKGARCIGPSAGAVAGPDRLLQSPGVA
jgi:hypothetical protein